MFTAGYALVQIGEVGHLTQVFFICEGWMSTTTKGKSVEMPPSQDPKRKEVLLISQKEIGKIGSEMVIYEMIRDGQGLLTSLVELKLPEDKEDSNVNNPILDAFVEGFRMGRRINSDRANFL
jgi:hypothetical protein